MFIFIGFVVPPSITPYQPGGGLPSKKSSKAGYSIRDILGTQSEDEEDPVEKNQNIKVEDSKSDSGNSSVHSKDEMDSDVVDDDINNLSENSIGGDRKLDSSLKENEITA